MEYKPVGNEVSVEAKESSLLEADTRKMASGGCNRLRTLVFVW
jgi:hypothetical protein